MTSYKIFDQLRRILPATGSSGHGIRMRVANFFFDKPIEQNEEEYEKMCEIEDAGVRSVFCTSQDSRLTCVSLQIDPRL